jgi:hypothetical protein
MSWLFQSFIGILPFNLESDSPNAKVYKAVGCGIEYPFLVSGGSCANRKATLFV